MDTGTARGELLLDRAFMVMGLEGERCAQVVPVSDELETVLLGVATLEGLGYKVDPPNRKAGEDWCAALSGG